MMACACWGVSRDCESLTHSGPVQVAHGLRGASRPDGTGEQPEVRPPELGVARAAPVPGLPRAAHDLGATAHNPLIVPVPGMLGG